MEPPVHDKKVILIAGPTAVGKTAVAIALARSLGTEIISADSRQCYREMRIGVAQPSAAELAAVPHHFIASHSIHQPVNAATFERYALEQAEMLFKKHDTIVMVGGTGLYIKAFCEGMDPMPEVDAEIRKAIIHDYEEKGLPWLQAEVAAADPQFYSEGEILNPHRLMRALEVVRATGTSILDFRRGEAALRPFAVLPFALDLPKEALHHNIHARVDDMMEEGLLDEVRQLLPYCGQPPLQTVGYAELFDYLEGSISLEGATEKIKTHTRQYAKRQLTWFRRDKGYTWLHPGGAVEAVLAALRQA